MVNYLLTTITANDEKGERTPFQWLSATNGWDAYKERVLKCAKSLRMKKVRLLTEADAAEQVQRYTSLAETAWIAKLAQQAANLFFGWRGGIQDGERKITVVSGGLCARIRRRYDLNRVLHPDAKGEKEAEKKNRADKRHHALDAMVNSFIPNWARDDAKQHFFRFPPLIHKDAKGFFTKEIKDVIPKNLSFEKIELGDKAYRIKKHNGKPTATIRRPLVELAYKSKAGEREATYSSEALKKNVPLICDHQIQQQLLDFLDGKPDEAAWIKFTQAITQKKKGRGSLITHVQTMVSTEGVVDEYKDLSKDHSGIWRKAKKSHKGQIVYLVKTKDKKGKVVETPRVRPVYVFESYTKVLEELKAELGKNLDVMGFFQSGCTVRTDKPVTYGVKVETTIPAGQYICNSIRKDGYAKLTSSSGRVFPVISLSNLKSAGFRLESR